MQISLDLMQKERKATCKADGSAAGTNLVKGGQSTIQLRGQAAHLLSALHVLVPALHHLSPQRCGLLVKLQLT
ncbi:MAG: hypothetical protein FRX49_10082 [Trebouxia sp. A1-2]|nr:MAG: hypothetical protein FRX49_10082 [Trebouxia sp. A1-2]